MSEDNEIIKISIVMAYYNRKTLFYNTLKSIEKSIGKDFVEIIVVDDGSDTENEIFDFIDMFNLNIKIIKIEKKNKRWHNSCISFNLGFRHTECDIVIIQNPECIHLGEVIDYTLNNIRENLYLNFGCYSVDKSNTDLIEKLDLDSPDMKSEIYKIVTPFNTGKLIKDGTNVWYNHSVYRPSKYHFCSAIMRSDLYDLGGFDERFMNGIGYDDDDFLNRIMKKKMELRIVDDMPVIHQYHYGDRIHDMKR